MITREEWKNIRGSSPSPDQIMLSIKGDASSSIAIRWRTDITVNEGFVLYKEQNEAEWHRAEALRHYFKTDMDESHFFFSHLRDLKADTVYEYNCGNNTTRSENFTFKTSKINLNKFTFLCISDIQSGDAEPPADYSTLNGILKTILKNHPECDFILTAGDNTNCGQTDIQWTGLFEGLKGIIESKPIMFCMGNHDDMGFENYFTKEGKYYSEYAEYFTNQLWGSYEHNGPKERPIANHAFDYGNAHFCLIGTSGYKEMNEWLMSEAEKTDKKWKFAVHHFPVNYSASRLEIDDTYPALRDGMDCFDFVISGHEHSFARSYPRKKEGLFDKPSEGTIHYNLGSSHRNSPAVCCVPKVWNAKTYSHEEIDSMYSIVEINGSECTITAYTEGDRIIDKVTVDKNNDTIIPVDLAPVFRITRLFFKGYDLGICNTVTLPRKIDNLWYISIGQLISFIGGEVERTKDTIKVSIYGKTSEFKEGEKTVKTQDGAYEMEAPCLRLNEGQLYAPVDDFCKNLRMTAYYYERNNFITIESDNQHVPVPIQP